MKPWRWMRWISVVLALTLAPRLVPAQQPIAAPDTELIDPYRKLAEALAATVSAGPINVGIGNFLYQDTDFMSPFSSKLRDEMKVALPMTGKFRVITRERLADLQLEGKFQEQQILEPGTEVKKVSIEGVQGIVRGKFYCQGTTVTIITELAWLEGGEVRTAKVELPIRDIGATLFPDQAPAAAPQVAALIQVQNVQESQSNLADIESRVKTIPRDFSIQLVTTDARRDYAEGETVSYRIRSEVGCHVAVFCHQSDGTTVVLFPNPWNQSTWIPAGKAVDIPGTVKHGFEIVASKPYGADVVQAIACTTSAP